MKYIKRFAILAMVALTVVSVGCFRGGSAVKAHSDQKMLEAERQSNSQLDVIAQLRSRNQTLQADIKKFTHLVNVTDIDSSVRIRLKYATVDNCTGKALYPVSVCLLREETARKLANAESEFLSRGYRIEIWDAYRPLCVQKILYSAAHESIYVANPANGSRHNRGAAVDITLVDKNGNEAEMPSGFDGFTDKAHRDYAGMSATARKNLTWLTSVMKASGFTTITSEWWHFDDSDWGKYPVLDASLEDFSE